MKNPQPKPNAKLKLVPRARRNPDEPDEFDELNIREGGSAPDDMKPADYVVECVDYRPMIIRGEIRAVILHYVTIDGAWRDVELRQWLPIYPGKPINVGTKTWRHWALARGAKPDRHEKFHPKIFLGKRFVAAVGYSSKDQGEKTFSEENTRRKKYESDRLRVHELKSRVP